VRLDNQPNDSVKIQVIQVALSRANGRSEFPPIPFGETNGQNLKTPARVIRIRRK